MDLTRSIKEQFIVVHQCLSLLHHIIDAQVIVSRYETWGELFVY